MAAPADRLYGTNDPEYWSQSNPELASLLATQRAASRETGFTKFSIWFGYGSDMTANYGGAALVAGSALKGNRATSMPVQQRDRLEPAGKNVTSVKSAGQSLQANSFEFQKNGYFYFNTTEKTGTGANIDHGISNGNSTYLVGLSEISNGNLTNNFNVPNGTYGNPDLRGQGVSKMMYQYSLTSEVNQTSGVYLLGSDNYAAYAKVYNSEKMNSMEAVYSTPAGRALGPSWYPAEIHDVIDKNGVFKGIFVNWRLK